MEQEKLIVVARAVSEEELESAACNVQCNCNVQAPA